MWEFLMLPSSLLCRQRAWGEGTGEWVAQTHGAQLGPSLGTQPPESQPSAPSERPVDIWCGSMPQPGCTTPHLRGPLAACPSPWQIKPQTEGKQYLAPGVSAGLIHAVVCACASREGCLLILCSFSSLPSLWPDWDSWATGRHLWTWEWCWLF